MQIFILLASFLLTMKAISAPDTSSKQEKTLLLVAAYLPANMDYEGKGREADIIKEVLACFKYKPKYDIQPYARHFVSFKNVGKYDAVATVPATMKLAGFDSVSHVVYQNGISSLTRKAKFRSLQELKKKRVVSFKGARGILPGLEENIPFMQSYEEMSRQDIHSQMLFTEKVDAVISDGLIFSAHNELLRKKNFKNPAYFQSASFHASFPPNPFKMVFRDEVLRDKFNSCYNQLAKDGTLKGIHNKYLEKYKDTLGDQYPSL